MAEVSIDVEPLTQSRPARERTADEPFRIAILGDFSGRARKQDPGPVRAIEIDPGNFEDVMERMGVALELAAGDVRLALQFRELDDFHPDNIYRSTPLFKAFEEARKELSKPRPAPVVEKPVVEKPAAAPPPPTGGSLLDMIAEYLRPPPWKMLPVKLEELVEFLQQYALGGNLWLDNGLTDAENRDLFQASDSKTIARLIIQGMSRLVGTAQ